MKLIIPKGFFEAIREQGNAAKVLWIDWFSDYAETLLLDNFCDNYECPYGQLTQEKVREVWTMGVALLRDGYSIQKEEVQDELVMKVITYLNKCCGSTYNPKSKKNRELITARVNEGYELPDFYRVIEKKTKQWLGTPQQIYLRPITLFSLTKFEQYLNETDIIVNNNKPTSFDNIKSAVQDAKRHLGLLP